MPFAGVGHAFGVIAQYAILSGDDLHKAGPLYTLVKVIKDDQEEIRTEPEHFRLTLFWDRSLPWASQPGANY